MKLLKCFTFIRSHGEASVLVIWGELNIRVWNYIFMEQKSSYFFSLYHQTSNYSNTAGWQSVAPPQVSQLSSHSFWRQLVDLPRKDEVILGTLTWNPAWNCDTSLLSYTTCMLVVFVFNSPCWIDNLTSVRLVTHIDSISSLVPGQRAPLPNTSCGLLYRTAACDRAYYPRFSE